MSPTRESARLPLFVDRESERAQLRALLKRPGPSLALVTGRRRVGKTYLLINTWPEAQTFYFVAAEGTSTINRRELVQSIARHFALALDPADYPTWRTVFRLLYELRTPEPLVVILDEFQYLMGTKDGVPSQLNAIHDVHRDDRPFVLVLCGSAVRTMEHLNAGDAPLYGRFARTIRVAPFDYFDAAALVPVSSNRERAIAYGIVGGTPRYLRAFQSDRSLQENVAAEVLAPGGQIRMQIESLIDQERGLRKTEEYKAILRAIGAGHTSAQEIASYVDMAHDITSLRRMLDRLVELGYVRAERNFAARRTSPYRYRLDDPALQFHAKMVSLFRSELATYDPAEVWEREIAPARLDTYMGAIFERIAAEGYQRHRQRLGLPMIEHWGRWEGTVTPQRGRGEPRSFEVDIVASLTDGRMLTGAIKWGDLGLDVHAKHLRELAVLADAGQTWAREALRPNAPLLYVTGKTLSADFKERAEQDGHPVYTLTMEDLYHGLMPAVMPAVSGG
ncbi:ATP-binding protein [Gemmatimonas sp.]|uniref:ATP-binding protein n=1 Tax=Gemmatimonas sp. TaxID=1962908 RepID=UPI00286E1F59|nr:ATP-binding protein [Gemmatimonas sp.]